MKSNISEFSYGYSLVSELISHFPKLKTLGAPEFPTQYKEGKIGGGWDVKVPGIAVYLQFKRTERMIRSTAKEAAHFRGLPFFRMYLQRRDRSDQHQLLLDLEKRGNVVLYAAPGFSEPEELNAAFSSDAIVASSVFIRPKEIGPLVDDDEHWVAFQTNPKTLLACSEPKRIDFESVEEIFTANKHVLEKLDARPKFLHAMFDDLMQIYYQRLHMMAYDTDNFLSILGKRDDSLQLLSKTIFQCELLILNSDG